MISKELKSQLSILKETNPYLSDPQAQYNKLLRTQQKLRNKKK